MKILLITDSSPQAEYALSFGAQIIPSITVPPTVLAVIDASPDNPYSQPEITFARAYEVLGEPNVHTQVRTGDPVEQILQVAYEGEYDLIIIGDRYPKNLLIRFFWHSLAVRVAENAPCSVIIARGNVSQIERILLCDNGSGRSALLSRLVAQLSNLLDGEEDITVLHVMSQVSAGPGISGAHLRADAQELIASHAPEGEILERDIQILDQPGVHPIPKVRHGLVVDEILAEASSGDYDLVVVGAHPTQGSQRFLLENIAHQILTRIRRSILVVRENNQSLSP